MGALLRYAVVLWLSQARWQEFPLGILAVNWIGSFMIAYLAVFLAHATNLPDWTSALLLVGFLGSFTTFSTFSLDNLKMIQQGAFGLATLYATLSVTGGILLAFIGFWLGNLMHWTGGSGN